MQELTYLEGRSIAGKFTDPQWTSRSYTDEIFDILVIAGYSKTLIEGCYLTSNVGPTCSFKAVRVKEIDSGSL